MARETPDLAGARAALEQGASPDEACSYSYTARRIHAAGALMSVFTGGLWLLTPILDDDLLTESVQRSRRVTPLRHAADRRHEGLLALLLEFGGDIDTLDGAFGAAVEAAELDWAERLAGLGAERSVETLPAELVYRGRVERLLAMEPDLSATSMYWSEPVVSQVAADPLLLDLLLDGGLDPGNLRSSFQASVAQGELTLARLLVERGAPRTLDELDVALMSDERRLQAVLALEPDLRELRIGWGVITQAEEHNPVVLEQLVAAGLPLAELAFRASEAHRWDQLDRALSLGFDIDSAWDGRFHRRLLNEAVADGDHEAVAALLDRGARMIEGSFDHPVERALDDGDMAMVALLLDRSTDRAAARDWWLQILRGAVIRGQLERAEFTVREGRLAGEDLAHATGMAIADEERTIAELLLSRTADRQAAVDTGLRAAAMGNNPGAIALALELGADAAHRGPNGETALNCAAYSSAGDPPAVIRALVEAGAPVDGFEDQQVPPLHLAVSEGLPESVEAIAALGARLDRLDGEGRTALVLAVEERDWESVTILARAGAPVDRELLLEAIVAYPYAPPEAALALAEGRHDEPPRFLRRLARRVSRRDPQLAEALRGASSR